MRNVEHVTKVHKGINLKISRARREKQSYQHVFTQPSIVTIQPKSFVAEREI